MPLVYTSIDQQNGATFQVRLRDVMARALIDTGSEYSIVDQQLARSLGLKPEGEIELQTPTGKKKKTTYRGQMTIVHSRADMVFPDLLMVGGELAQQDLDMILGRDVLSKCILQWNGPMRVLATTY